ncbi:MAG: succinate dehydrogenase [Bacteroidia bacterium]|nr:MAG: succinate dehydrogenase [Bacteroidia bacterium]PIE86440.1 MAG: succinate dehydrogenase [Bacteroidia bacterium]
MSNFLTSSIGKKLLMSITGLFLIVFLVVHLSINLLLLIRDDGDLFNQAAHFMATNPIIRVVEPLLAVGFIVHIIYATFITLHNRKARPVAYLKTDQSNNCTWQSRNMYILGGLVLIFLVLHIVNFYWEIKIAKTLDPVNVSGVEMDDTYKLVTSLFQQWWYAVIYVLGAIFLGLHLSHGFWSAFQTLGWSGHLWRKRLTVVSYIYAIIIGFGFAIIPIVLMFQS